MLYTVYTYTVYNNKYPVYTVYMFHIKVVDIF